MAALFVPGTLLIPPDKEGSAFPYVDGVLMNVATGAQTGTIPNTVTYTTDGAVLSTGTMGVLQRQQSTEQTKFYIYDTSFNEISATAVWTGLDINNSPPDPCSDFASTFYVPSTQAKAVKSVSATGVVGSTYGTLAAAPVAIAVIGTTLYYYDGSGNIQTWNLGSNTAGSTFWAHTSFPSGFGTGTSLRALPTIGTLFGTVNNSNTGNVELWQWATSGGGAGTVLTKTPLAGLVANTDPTIQVDVGNPAAGLVCRSYPGTDRVSGCTFQFVEAVGGTIVRQYGQTIALSDGGVTGGVLPATCPVFSWTPTYPAGSGTGNGWGPANGMGGAPGWPYVVPPSGTIQASRRLRRFSLPFDNNVLLFLRRLEFLVQSGVGLIAGQGSNPLMMVRISGDGGLTWSQELAISFGKMGDFTHRAILHQLGQASNFVVEVTVTDPVFAAFLDCFADLEPGAW